MTGIGSRPRVRRMMPAGRNGCIAAAHSLAEGIGWRRKLGPKAYSVTSLEYRHAIAVRNGQFEQVFGTYGPKGGPRSRDTNPNRPAPAAERRLAKLLAGRSSLVPAGRSYVGQLRLFEDQQQHASIAPTATDTSMRSSGTGNSTDGPLRQKPVNRGRKELISVQREADGEARLRISAWLRA